MGDIAKMADMAAATSYFSTCDLFDTSVAERGRPYRLLLTTKGSGARSKKRIPDSRARERQPTAVADKGALQHPGSGHSRRNHHGPVA